MVIPVLLAVSVAGWVPARWSSPDPATLELIRETPVNCVLLEQAVWSAEFAAQAAKHGVATLGVLRPGEGLEAAARRAAELKLSGVVLEGEFDGTAVRGVRDALERGGLTVLELPPRRLMKLDAPVSLAGTYQGVWPGVQLTEKGAVRAMPTGGPWIDTNSGFLRFLTAVTSAPVWLANTPPAGRLLPVDRYLQAICDSAMTGARWVVALDSAFERRLLAREADALRDWRRIGTYLRYFEEHKEWKALTPYSRLALIQAPDAGALLSGGILDMIAVKHTPVRPVPTPQLSQEVLKGANLAVAVDASSLSAEQKQELRNFTRGGNTLLTGPPGWKLPEPKGNEITLDKPTLDKVSDVWQGINSLIGRTNLGARLFNVSSMLSSLLAGPDGSPVVLHLVNYSNYPVESITVHALGKYKRARLEAPERPPRDLEVYPVNEGTGIDIDRVWVCATLTLE